MHALRSCVWTGCSWGFKRMSGRVTASQVSHCLKGELRELRFKVLSIFIYVLHPKVWETVRVSENFLRVIVNDKLDKKKVSQCSQSIWGSNWKQYVLQSAVWKNWSFLNTHTQGLIDSLSLFDLLPVQSQPNSLKHSMCLQRRCLSRDWCSVPKAGTFTFYQLWRTDKSSGLWSSLLLMESQGWLCWVHLRAPHIFLQTLLEFFCSIF